MPRLLSAMAGIALFGLTACGAAPPPAAEPAPSRCEALVGRYRAAVTAGTYDCASDVDCVAYGGVDPDDLCGGAANAETGRTLSLISDELNAAGCPRPGYSCPAIALRCAAGSCR